MSTLKKGNNLANIFYFKHEFAKGGQYVALGGHDKVFGSYYADVILGGQGNDKLFGLKGNDKIKGGRGDDKIDGGKGHDKLWGDRGKDKIDGGKGHDKIYGGKHNDTLNGEQGFDKLYGGQGQDKLYGGSHNDYLSGGRGNDKLWGGLHHDKLLGDNGHDWLFGGGGADRLYGGYGDDFLFGGNHRDKLFGGRGDDILFGQSGDDTLNGGRGRDTLDGGLGDDRLIINLATDIDIERSAELVDGGDGFDTLVLQIDSSQEAFYQALIDAAFEYVNGFSQQIDLIHLNLQGIEKIIVQKMFAGQVIAESSIASALFDIQYLVDFKEDNHKLTTATVVAKLYAVTPGVALSFALSGHSEDYVISPEGHITLTEAGIEAMNNDINPITELQLSVDATNIYGNRITQSFSAPIERVNDLANLSIVKNLNITEGSVRVGDVLAKLVADDAEGDDYALSISSSDLYELHGHDIVLTTAGVSAINNDGLDGKAIINAIDITAYLTDGEHHTSMEVTLPVSRVNDAPSISYKNENVVEESISAGDIITRLSFKDSSEDDFKISISASPYYELSQDEFGYHVVLTQAGVDAINNDDLNIKSFSFDAVSFDGESRYSKHIHVPISRVNEAPSVKLDDSYNIYKGEVSVVNVIATDAETTSDDLVYRIVGGRDADLFSIDDKTKMLQFNQPAEVGAVDEQYQVNISVSDGISVVNKNLDVYVDAGTTSVLGNANHLHIGELLQHAGDTNKDGYDDYFVTSFQSGSASLNIIYGSAHPAQQDTLPLVSTAAIQVLEDFSFNLISDSAYAGDYNGDGINDIWAPSHRGMSMLYGEEGGLPHHLTLTNHSPEQGFYVSGVGSVYSAGDFNGDGLDDLGGSQYIVYGEATLHDANINVRAEAFNGFKFSDALSLFRSHSDRHAERVTSIGDINGDGLDELLYYEEESHQVKILYGLEKNLSNTKTDKLAPYQLDADSYHVAGGGDFNGDGYRDFVIHNGYRSDVYVLFGQKEAMMPNLDINLLNGHNGFSVSNINYRPGTDSTYGRVNFDFVGDFNGDGYDDLIVKTYGHFEAKLIYGNAHGFNGHLDLSHTSSTQGSDVSLQGFAESGVTDFFRNVFAGDVNGDGFDDVLLGNNLASNSQGEVKTIYGRDSLGLVTHKGSDADDVVVGTDGDDVIFTYQGNDILKGHAGADRFNGGNGDDTFYIDAQDIEIALGNIISGGHGFDTVVLDVAHDLDLSALRNNALMSIEAIDMSEAGANTLTLDVASLVKLSDDGNDKIDNPHGYNVNELLVKGDAEDTVELVGVNQWISDDNNGEHYHIEGELYDYYYVNRAEGETSLVAIDVDIDVDLLL